MISINPQKFGNSYQNRLKKTHGITLALYGDNRPEKFLNLIDQVLLQLKDIENWICDFETPERIKSIHATIVGLEGRRTGDGRILNDNLIARLGGLVDQKQIPEMDLEGLLDFFKNDALWPLEIQIGGFTCADDRRNPYEPKSPFDRTFDIHENGLIVMVGWPVISEQRIAPFLLGMRKYVERFNVVHKYHIVPHQQDNAFFFVLGSLNFNKWNQANEEEKGSIRQQLGQLRAKIRESRSQNPCIIEIKKEHIRVVEYSKTTLEEVSFDKQVAEVTADELKGLYQD
ncbi:hypothetical protein HYR99_00455 [Candidatus Poribacteria bacterium]|nr:hypothetical protein [Candidatus Poribacteria bacterium]